MIDVRDIGLRSTKRPGPLNLKLFKDTKLTCDPQQHRLRHADIVKLVDYHVAHNGTEGYSSEVFNAGGDTIAVPASVLEAFRGNEILCARTLTR